MIENFKRLRKIKPKASNFFRSSALGLVFIKTLSELKHYLSMFFLDYKIGKYGKNHFCDSTFIEDPFESLFKTLRSFSGILKASKVLEKPFNQFLVCVNHINSRVEMSISTFGLAVGADIKSAFTVKNSSKISKLSRCPHQISSGSVFSLRLNHTTDILNRLAATTNPRGTREREVIV